jgi:predicted membrane chloride channel (bestrophin family)
MAISNPRKELKRATDPLGNLPLEILTNLSAYIKELFNNGTFKVSIYQTQAMNNLSTLNDVLTGTDRVLNTPLPIAYSIAISQVTWVYVCMLPFQLYKTLDWVTIPATMVAAYIILGIALIGNEIENPFGNDVNDLPLEAFCESLMQDIAVLTSKAPPKPKESMKSETNLPLFPLSSTGFEAWADKSVDGIREGLRARAHLSHPKKEENGLKQATEGTVEMEV